MHSSFRRPSGFSSVCPVALSISPKGRILRGFPMTSAQIVPALVVPLIAWRVYSRVRRTVGRQPFHPTRLVITIVILGAVTGLIAAATARVPAALAGLGGGLLIAAGLAAAGFRLTKFECTPHGRFYTPNAIIGIGVTLLFIARLAYRMVVLLGSSPTVGPMPAGASFSNPLTLLFFGITAGYYIFYYAAVLWRCRQPHADGTSQ
jgi:hypothetical protein